MDPLRRKCAGARQRSTRDFPAGYWSVAKHDTTLTFCALCVELGVMPADELAPVDHTRFATIACDGPARLEAMCGERVRFGDFVVKVHHTDGTAVIEPAKREAARTKGVGVFLLPTQTTYKVDISMNSIRAYGGDRAFSIESFHVGDQRARIFGDHASDASVRIARAVSVESLTPGGKGFHFVSVTPGERERGEVPPQVAAGYGDDNHLTLRLQMYARVRRHHAPERMAGGEQQQQQSHSDAALDIFAQLDISPTHPPTTHEHRLTSGTTVAGPSRVPVHTTVDTTDVFVPAGPVVTIVLQLACYQSDAHKEADNARALLHERGYDYWMHEANKCDATIAMLTASIALQRAHMARSRERVTALLEGRPTPPLYATDYMSDLVRAQTARDAQADCTELAKLYD